MAKKMLIDATHPEETRVVVVDGQRVEDFDFESITKRQLAGNIYLAKVTRVEPSLQAAFVEYGGNRHGFLTFSEIHPDYYQIPVADREALLEEERREVEALQQNDATGDGNGIGGRSSRRGGRGRKRRAAAAADESVATTGLEIIEIQDANSDEPPADAVSGAASEIDGTPSDLPSANDASDDAHEKPEGGPRTIAENAGLEDTDRVTGEVGAPDTARKETQDDRAETAADAIAADASDTAAEGTNVAGETIEESAKATSRPRRRRRRGDVSAERSGKSAGSEEIEDSAGPKDAESPSASAADADANASPSETADESRAGELDAPEAAPLGEEDPKDDDALDKPRAEAAEASDGRDAGEGAAAVDDNEGMRPSRRRRRKSRRGEEDESVPDGSGIGDIETIGAEDVFEAPPRPRLRRKYNIQDVIKVRQILLVQVVKEERSNKGAALTTYLSLAGRYCVLMPNTARGGGISRKITDSADRKHLRDVVDEMDVPTGIGLIVRTAGAKRTRAEIKRDYEFLIRQWEQIRDLTLKSIAPTLIYEEGSLIKRSIRDIYSKEIDQILVEGETGYREAKEYMKTLMPSHAKNVQPYTDPIPLFSRYQVESYLNGMFNPTVQLKSGGYIVIGVTEALVAIDVNSGRSTREGSIEETAVKTNLEAADEIARQLRLRDLAGLIVIDFIDMDDNRNNRAVEKRMKERLKNDRARIQVGRISGFGLMEMSRQRLRPGMLEITTRPCPHCSGVGLIRSDESLSLAILREVEEEGLRGRSDEATIRAPIDVANYLVNNKRPHIAGIEARHDLRINVLADPLLTSPDYEIERTKSAGATPRRWVEAAPTVSTADGTVSETAEAESTEENAARDETEGRSRRRRGKRGGRRRRGEEQESQVTETAEAPSRETDENDDDEGRRARGQRVRGRRRGGRGRREGAGDVEQAAEDGTSEAENAAAEVDADGARVETASAAGVDAASDDRPAASAVDAEGITMVERADEAAPAKPKRRGWWSFGS